jgi:topoisomerase IV subunit B
MAPDTRRLVRLTAANGDDQPELVMDRLLAKARASDRREWLTREGDRAELEV